MFKVERSCKHLLLDYRVFHNRNTTPLTTKTHNHLQNSCPSNTSALKPTSLWNNNIIQKPEAKCSKDIRQTQRGGMRESNLYYLLQKKISIKTDMRPITNQILNLVSLFTTNCNSSILRLYHKRTCEKNIEWTKHNL